MFPPLYPTRDEHAAFARTAQQLLDATLQHYQVHTFHHRRAMNRERWKPVKSREYLTVYKERNPAPVTPSSSTVHSSSSGSSSDSTNSTSDWHDPKLLVATGAIVGTLDDVMFGVVTPDAASMRLKAAITKNRLIGGTVLASLTTPNASDPFQFLGIKWFVLGAPATLASVIQPRDLVFLEATGIETLPNGDRVGYQVLQSVSLPGFGPLPASEGITRGRIASCSVFKQLANGTVDVYVRGHVDALGKVFDAVALKFAASGFLSAWNAVGVARYKKLVWCVQQQHQQRRPTTTHSHSSTGAIQALSSLRACAACSKRLHTFSSVVQCVLCDAWVCAHCRVVSTLRHVEPTTLVLTESTASVCVPCVAFVEHQDARAVAQSDARSHWVVSPTTNAQPVVKLWPPRVHSAAKPRHRAKTLPLEPLPPACEYLDVDLDLTQNHNDRQNQDNTRNHKCKHNRSNGNCSNRGLAHAPELVQLFDPTLLFGSAKSRTHSSDSESSLQSPMHEERHPWTTTHSVTDKHNVVPAAPPLSHVQHSDTQRSQLEQYEPQHGSPPPQQQPQQTEQQQQQLYKRMLDLHAATEHVYQLTLQTTDEHIPARCNVR